MACGHPFTFEAKDGYWEFSARDDQAGGESESSIYVLQRARPGMTEAEVRRLLTRFADAYLFAIGRRRSDLSAPVRDPEGSGETSEASVRVRATEPGVLAMESSLVSSDLVHVDGRIGRHFFVSFRQACLAAGHPFA